MNRTARLWLQCVGLVCFACSALWAQATSSENPSADELRLRDDWRVSLAQVPLSKKGCFQASYPSKEWRQVVCKAAPNRPMPPRRGARPLVVGNGDDISAQAPTGFISTAIGSFDSVTNVTSESGPIGNSGPAIANAYTLQLNMNFFNGTVCAGASVPGNCSTWQQFVFENDGAAGGAFIQYWILKYNNPCPPGQNWNQFSFTGSTDIYCWKNDTSGAVSVPNQPITNLGQMSLSGAVSTTADSVSFTSGGTAYSITGDNAVNAAAGWTIAEFNIFGDGGNSGGGGTASFNSGASIVTRNRIIYGGTAPPNCAAQGFTAEKNNLSFGPTAPAATSLGPAVVFNESTAGGATSNCAAATTIGDTHLDTFQGLLYDFQASGDFVVAQADPDFLVVARQVSGAPTWPNAAVNHAIATRMGKDRMAVCLAPARLNVNGDNTELEDGKVYSTADGVDIWRIGNVYLITSANGNSVRAEVNPTWINVSVGLGKWPNAASGLLANAGGNVNQIAGRDGAVLTAPFAFDELYLRYGQSWHIAQEEESLLSACGERNVATGNPAKTFYAGDLDKKVYERTRGVCTAAGVKGDALIDACTLDVAVIGNDAAATVFVNARQPVAVATITGGGSEFPNWLWFLLLIIVILFLLWLLQKRKKP
jgi:hypothetical protein